MGSVDDRSHLFFFTAACPTASRRSNTVSQSYGTGYRADFHGYTLDDGTRASIVFVLLQPVALRRSQSSLYLWV